MILKSMRAGIRVAHMVYVKACVKMASPSGRDPGLSLSNSIPLPIPLTAHLCRLLCILWSGLILAGMAALSSPLQAADIQHTYDKAGRLIQTIAPNGASVQYTYDAVGNIVNVKRNASSTLTIAGFTPTSGPAGTIVTINGNGFNTTPANNTVKFNGVAATVSAATATSLTVAVPASATTGPITVTNANGSATTAVPFTVGGTASALTPGGLPVAISLAANGTAGFTFTGQKGQGYALGLTGLVFTPAGGTLTVTVTQPGGAALTTTCSGAITATTGCVLPYLPVDGDYTVTLKAGAAAAVLGLSLNADRSGVLEDAAYSEIFIDKVGLAATYTFTPARDLQGLLVINGDRIRGTSRIEVYSPNGAVLKTQTVTASEGADGTAELSFSVAELAVSGAYKLRVIPPAGNATGRMMVKFVQDKKLVANGAAVTTNLLPSGEKIYYTFDGTVGQRLGLGLSDLVITPPSGYTGSVSVQIYKQDNSLLSGGSFTMYSPAGGAVLPALPETGQYRVLISSGNNAATFNLLLTADATGTLASGVPVNFAPARVGQAASYTFNATVGQTVNLSLGGSTFTGTTYLYVYRPSDPNTNYKYLYVGGGSSGSLTLTNLPESGTYTARVVPPTNGSLGTVTVGLRTTEAVTAGAGPLAVSLPRGQSVSFTFDGTVGQRLGLGLSDLVITPPLGYTGALGIQVYKQDGTALRDSGFTMYNPAGGAALPVLPETGQYRIEIQPSNNAATFNLLLTTDATGTLASGVPINFAPARVGQAASYTFNATAGQTVNLSLGGSTFTSTTYLYVYRPSDPNTLYKSFYVGSGNSNSLTLANLPESGTYTARVVPPTNGSLGTVAVGLRTTEAVTAGAGPLAVSLP